mmetsp:Transcript_56953/g.64544  ORF Transcript_56953/g.64544 Transcript_56953/m.64544 type:complete len:132 (-) Transcript_56953:1119-1514(-)
MFPVNRFDPRKEDRRKKVENKKKRTEYGSQSNDSQNDPRKKKKKKSKNTQHNNNNHDKDVKHHDDSHSDARSIKKETPVVTSTLEYSPKVITNQNVSSSKIPSCGEKPEAATFQVIAPETNGAISSKKKFE